MLDITYKMSMIPKESREVDSLLYRAATTKNKESALFLYGSPYPPSKEHIQYTNNIREHNKIM